MEPTTHTTHKEETVLTTEAKIGYFLLLPPLLSVLLFALSLFNFGVDVADMKGLSSEWTGNYGESGGYTSAAPIYLGLMAIAGAMLTKNGRVLKVIS